MSTSIFEKVKMKRFLYFLALALVFSSCNSDDSVLDELTKNRQLWQSHQIEDYSWNERISCFCAGPLERDIFVVNLIKEKVDFDETGYDPEYLEELREFVFNSAKTIDDAFDLVEVLLSREVAQLEIQYDEVYGFPTLISVDYEEQIADDEIAYIYTDFRITN